MPSEDLAHLAARLQCLGVRVPADAPGRRGGAGPSEGVTLLLAGRALTVPAFSGFVAQSPYSLERAEGGWFLFEAGLPVLPACLAPEARFCRDLSAQGEPLSRTALLHGLDCLATTVFQDCVRWGTPGQCRFCGIRVSRDTGAARGVKDPADLARAARLARELDHARHAVLTTGSFGADPERFAHLLACVSAVAGEGLPVHVQVEPPGDPGVLEALHAAGAKTVGIHLESPDPRVLCAVAPGKAALGKGAFLRAWKRAVEIFGKNQVSTFFLAGLGEDPAVFLEGVALAAGLGVFPLVLPLRPVPGSLLSHALPPDPEYMEDLYARAAEILLAAGLFTRASLAGCVRCSACSAYGWRERAGG